MRKKDEEDINFLEEALKLIKADKRKIKECIKRKNQQIDEMNKLIYETHSDKKSDYEKIPFKNSYETLEKKNDEL